MDLSDLRESRRVKINKCAHPVLRGFEPKEAAVPISTGVKSLRNAHQCPYEFHGPCMLLRSVEMCYSAPTKSTRLACIRGPPDSAEMYYGIPSKWTLSVRASAGRRIVQQRPCKLVRPCVHPRSFEKYYKIHTISTDRACARGPSKCKQKTRKTHGPCAHARSVKINYRYPANSVRAGPSKMYFEQVGQNVGSPTHLKSSVDFDFHLPSNPFKCRARHLRGFEGRPKSGLAGSWAGPIKGIRSF